MVRPMRSVAAFSILGLFLQACCSCPQPAAGPDSAERANTDQETLSMPIQDPNVYEPCKPGAARIKMKIAVWDGKAVGLDVTSTPKNEKLVSCIKDQIKKLSWKAHVKSLNTVEY